MRQAVLTVLCMAAVLASPVARAEIQQTPNPGCGDGCVATWPRITLPANWKQDTATSLKDNIDFIVPDDQALGDTTVFIYANASLDSGDKLDDFVISDMTGFYRDDPDLKTTQLPDLTTADGQALQVYSFDPGKPGGRWEAAAYGEETAPDGSHYFLTFVISAVDQAHRDDNMGAFRGVILNYRK